MGGRLISSSHQSRVCVFTKGAQFSLVAACGPALCAREGGQGIGARANELMGLMGSAPPTTPTRGLRARTRTARSRDHARIRPLAGGPSSPRTIPCTSRLPPLWPRFPGPVIVLILTPPLTSELDKPGRSVLAGGPHGPPLSPTGMNVPVFRWQWTLVCWLGACEEQKEQ